MTLPAFALERPATVAQAVALLAGDHARVLAGGTDLVPNLLRGIERPAVLVDLGRVAGLADIVCDRREIAIGAVLSSRWCRCLETARLAFGRVEAWPPLDSFFGDRAGEPARTREVLERAKRWRGPGTLVMVTHQVNIAAATGESTAMGEGVVIDRTGRVVGRVPALP